MSAYKAQRANIISNQHVSDESASQIMEGIAMLNAANCITFCDGAFLMITEKKLEEIRNLSITELFPDLANNIDTNLAVFKHKFLYQDKYLLEITFSTLLDADESLTSTAVLLKRNTGVSAGKPANQVSAEEQNSKARLLYQETEGRKSPDVALPEKKDFISKITDLVPCLIALYNTHTGQYMYINQALESLLGYSPDILLEQGAPFLLSLIHPDDRESLLKKNAEALQQAAASKQADMVVDFEYRIRHKNGEWRWIHTSGIAFDKDPSGNVSHILNISIDITERKQTELKIQDSRHLIEQIAYTTPVLLYIFDITTHKNLYANRRMEEMLGYTQAEMQEMGENLFTLIMHPHDYAKFQDNVTRLGALKDGEIFENELRLKNANGEWRWFFSRETVFKRDPDGKAIEILGSSQDITQRKFAEQNLLESRHFIKQVADAIPDVLYVYDLEETRLLYINREIYHRLGYTPEEVYAMGSSLVKSLTHPDDFPERLDHFHKMRTLKEGEILEIEYRLKSRKGGWVLVRSRDSIFKRNAEGLPVQVIGVSQDITAHKMAEDEIRAKNKFIEAILSKLPVIITRIDKKGTIIEAVGSGLRNLGLADNHIKGVNVFENYPDIAQHVKEVLQGKSVTFIGIPSRGSKRRYFLNNFFFDPEKETAIGFSIDITEQKIAEEKLKESETRLMQLNEDLERRVHERTSALALSQERYEIASYVTHDAIWDWNLLTNELTYSTAYFSIFGYDPAEASDMVEEWYLQIHPDDKIRVTESIQQVISSGGQVWSEEYRHLRKDGSYAYVLDRGYVQREGNGKAVRMVGAMADITQRKLAEEAIRKSEAKFRHVFESGMIGIFFWNSEGTVTEANDTFLNILGYSLSDLAAGRLNWMNMTPEKYAVTKQRFIDKLSSNKISTPFEIECIRKDGSYVPIMLGGVLLQGDENYGVAYVLNITEQKKTQQDLALSEERFRLVTRATNDAVRDLNLETGMLWWNEGFKNMFGYVQEQIETGIESWYSRIHPDDVERVLQSIHKIIDNKHIQWSDEYRFRRADDSYAYILDRTYVIYNQQGKAIRMLGSMVDVTYLKEVQEALEQQAAELKQSNADLEQFAYISSHDLQEPLNTAASFAKLLEKKYRDKLDTDALEFISFIVNSTDRMKILIRSVLDYSKINSMAKSYEQANMKALIKIATDNLRANIQLTSAAIHIGEMPTLPVIPSQIIQLFQHMISNAIKFRSDHNPEIFINATEQTQHFLFSIQDNGIGIDMLYADRIFQVFQRLHSRDEYEGAGIGLATCKRIVDRHHGNIWVESSPGKGAVFFFTLKK